MLFPINDALSNDLFIHNQAITSETGCSYVHSLPMAVKLSCWNPQGRCNLGPLRKKR